MTATRDELVAGFEREHEWWRALLGAIGTDRMEEPGMMGDWSAKDLIAHLNGWQWKTVASFRCSLSGESLPPTPWPQEWNDPADWEQDGEVDPINAWLREQASPLPAHDVVATSLRQWDELSEILAGLTDGQWREPQRFRRLQGQSLAQLLSERVLSAHAYEHAETDVEPWLRAHGRRS
jgi:hypothetical protein